MTNDERMTKLKRRKRRPTSKISDLEFRASFVIRHSSFSSPHFCLPQLLQQQFFERRGRAGSEKVDSAALAEFAQALDEVLQSLLIPLKAIAAKGHLLHRAGFRIDQSQVAISGGRKFFRRED